MAVATGTGLAIAGGAAAAGGIASAVAGGMAASDAADSAANTAKNAAGRFYNFQDPDYQAMKLQLDKMVVAGQLSPEQETAVLQDPSAMNAISSDPRLKNAEMQSLAQLSNISNQKGLDAGAQSKLMQAQIQNASAAKGARDANLQNAAQRGVAGSGLEFTSNQIADQGAANSNAMVGTQATADANARELEALKNMSGLSTNLDAQDFAKKASIAQANDNINNFNTRAKQAVSSANVQSANAAKQFNLTNAQRVSDQNTLIGNAEQQYNKELPQTQFTNNLARAQGAAGLAGTQANAQMAGGQALANLGGGLAQAGLGAAGSIFGNAAKKKLPDGTEVA